jgi:hypothetical protein
MLLAYIDESGNTGDVSLGGATSHYVLGCVLIDADKWSAGFDELVAFRRRLRDRFGLPVRAEVKANYLIRSSGPLRSLALAPGERSLIYRAHLDMLAQIEARAFAIVIDKQRNALNGSACFEFAWTTLLQRLERTTHYEKQKMMIIHDDGENDSVRRIVRKARRFLTAGSITGGGSLRVDAKHLVDDPVPRASHESYLVQMADLVAYAAWRALVPPSRSVATVVPQETWSQVGTAVHAAVNRLSGGTPGVVVR